MTLEELEVWFDAHEVLPMEIEAQIRLGGFKFHITSSVDTKAIYICRCVIETEHPGYSGSPPGSMFCFYCVGTLVLRLTGREDEKLWSYGTGLPDTDSDIRRYLAAGVLWPGVEHLRSVIDRARAREAKRSANVDSSGHR